MHPTGNYIFVEQDEKKSEAGGSGFVLTEEQSPFLRGTVHAVGVGVDMGSRFFTFEELGINPGDRVIFPNQGSTPKTLRLDAKDLLVLTYNAVIATE